MEIATAENADRRVAMGLLARAPAARLAELWAAFGYEPAHQLLRAPEIGTAMVRGRAGAVGAPFNLGEVSVTRCSVSLEDGAVGHAYCQGRDREKARVAALLDALLQGSSAARVRETVLAPLAAEEDAQRKTRAAKADATRVEFFTMVRGEG